MQTVCNTYWDAGKGNLTARNTRKAFGGRGSAPNPAEGAYIAPANPLVGGEGLAVPSTRTPSPDFGQSGLASPTAHSKTVVPTPLLITLRNLVVGLVSHTARAPQGRPNNLAAAAGDPSVVFLNFCRTIRKSYTYAGLYELYTANISWFKLGSIDCITRLF